MWRLYINKICVCPPIAWKQWLLPTKDVQFVCWHHNVRTHHLHSLCTDDRAHPGMVGHIQECQQTPGSTLQLWHQYTNCAASAESNHCFEAIVTCTNSTEDPHPWIMQILGLICGSIHSYSHISQQIISIIHKDSLILSTSTCMYYMSWVSTLQC